MPRRTVTPTVVPVETRHTPQQWANPGHKTTRDTEWLTEANAWCKAMVHQYWQDHRSGLHTVADLLVWLDTHPDVPREWVRWAGQYQTRYQMVRNACVTMARQGYLETSTTVNRNDREAVAYHYAGSPSDGWSVNVDDPTGSDQVAGLLRAWLFAHRKELADVRSITLLRREVYAETARGTGNGPALHRRRTARGTGSD